MSGKGPEQLRKQAEAVNDTPETDVDAVCHNAAGELKACRADVLEQVQTQAPESAEKAADDLSAAEKQALDKLQREAEVCRNQQKDSAVSAAHSCSSLLSQSFSA